MRKFEKVKRIKENIQLPKRATKCSAGYDFFAIEDSVIEPISHCAITKVSMFGDVAAMVEHEHVKPTLIKTGVKVKIEPSEYLMLANRSSNPKKGLILANGIGVVDADYYGNPDNDGEIMFAYLNISNEPVVIKKGDKIGQGIITPYYTIDDDYVEDERVGGFGSSGR